MVGSSNSGGCGKGTSGCVPYYSIPSAKLSCSVSCAGGGNLPSGPLDSPVTNYGCHQKPKKCPDKNSFSTLAGIVVSVVDLGNPNGVTNEEILQYYTETLYPMVPKRQQLTLTQVNGYVNQAIRQGALRKTQSGTVVVYSFFGDLPSNAALVKEFGGQSIYQSCLGLFCLKRP